MPLNLVSWNVNGIRSCFSKGFEDAVLSLKPQIICLQETKATPEQIELPGLAKFHAYWNCAEKKGYSGTAIFAKEKPLAETYGIGVPEHDREGRVITLEFADFYLVNVYTPNSQRELLRLPYRQAWDAAFLAHVTGLETKKPVVFCGDLNVAHKEIDLKNPASNRRNAGFTDEERAGFDQILAAGYVDTFREFEQGPEHYSWWTYRMNARARNVGWRIDYFLASERLRPQLKAAKIHPEIMGSDHCPVSLTLK